LAGLGVRYCSQRIREFLDRAFNFQWRVGREAHQETGVVDASGMKVRQPEQLNLDASCRVDDALIGSSLGKALDCYRLIFLFGILMIVVGLFMLKPKKE